MVIKKPINNPALKSWVALNNTLRAANIKTCELLLDEELAGRRRKMFILRIHSRYNRLRADQERLRLLRRLKR